jgi:hypothetical protein
MGTAKEIEQAIRSLSSAERDKLLHHLPRIFPELDGDAEWLRIVQDDTPRAALTELLNETETDYRGHPDKFPPMGTKDFDANA